MEKIKAVLEILEEKSWYWNDLYGDELDQCIAMLKEGIVELQDWSGLDVGVRLSERKEK